MCARTQHESRCISLSIITIVPATANAFRIIATAIFSYHVVFDIPMLYYDRMWNATYEYDNRPAKIKTTICYALHTSRLNENVIGTKASWQKKTCVPGNMNV
jgi:hypothetical protein